MFTARERDKRYSNFIKNYDDDFHDWQLIPLTRAFAESVNLTAREAKHELGDRYEEMIDEFVLENSHRVVQPVPPAYDGVGQATRDVIDLSKDNPGSVYLQKRKGYSDIYVRNGKRWLFYKDKLIREEIATAYPRFAKENAAYPLTVYGEQSRLTSATLGRERITFKQTPYDVKART